VRASGAGVRPALIPAAGQSPAGFLPGVDGYMLRTQIQFAF
jgi:hypothetical protein